MKGGMIYPHLDLDFTIYYFIFYRLVNISGLIYIDTDWEMRFAHKSKGQD